MKELVLILNPTIGKIQITWFQLNIPKNIPIWNKRHRILSPSDEQGPPFRSQKIYWEVLYVINKWYKNLMRIEYAVENGHWVNASIQSAPKILTDICQQINWNRSHQYDLWGQLTNTTSVFYSYKHDSQIRKKCAMLHFGIFGNYSNNFV